MRTAEPDGPLVQSISIAFRGAIAATVLLALAWLASDIRRVPPDTTAVVTRFGRVVDVRSSGLLLALPRPIEAVRLLEGPERQIPLAMERVAPAAGLDGGGSPGRAPAPRISPTPQFGAAGSYLTADGGVVLIDVALTYRIADPAAFMLAEAHVAPALNRLFRAAMVGVAAKHPLDDFLVVDQGRAAATRATATAVLRDEVVATINGRLAALGGELGVAVTRLDLTASLPTAARGAFERVLSAGQQAAQDIATARTDATRRLQEADRKRDDLINAAKASAAERVTKAHAQTDEIAALSRGDVGGRANLLDQIYRERIAKLIPAIGQLTAVDPSGGVRLILPGAAK